MLEQNLINSTMEYLNLLESDIVFNFSNDESENSKQMEIFLNQIKELSSKISIKKINLIKTPSFSITSNQIQDINSLVFAAIPLGHEYTSFIMAALQVSGRKPKISDETIEQIKSISSSLNFTTYISLSCHNCPEVVQAINIMSVLNPNIKHTIVDGSLFKQEVEEKNIMAVPAIHLNSAHFNSGKMSLEEILRHFISNDLSLEKINNYSTFDSLIIGGGPAGSAAAIYSSRKGIKTAILADKIGGQVLDTVSIENFISSTYTEGKILAQKLDEHIKSYQIEQILNEKAKKITPQENVFNIELESGSNIKSKSIIITTGAKWRELNVPGEKEFKGKGVAYCPHCDGPLFKNKIVAVIGGGNSGVEAAIDLSGIVQKVYLLEFGSSLRADAVLQNKINKIPNIEVILNAKTTQISGEQKVNALFFEDVQTHEKKEIKLDGVFVQIGLIPNTSFIKDLVNTNKMGEITVDSHCSTNIPGIFSAGDCTDTPFKQIVIAIGEGAKASLSAFEYLMKK